MKKKIYTCIVRSFPGPKLPLQQEKALNNPDFDKLIMNFWKNYPPEENVVETFSYESDRM